MSNPLNIFDKSPLFTTSPFAPPPQYPQNPLFNQNNGLGILGSGISNNMPLNNQINLFQQNQNQYVPSPPQTPVFNQSNSVKNIFGVDVKPNSPFTGGSNYQSNQYGNPPPLFTSINNQHSNNQSPFSNYAVPQYQKPYDNRNFGEVGQVASEFLKHKNVPFERFINFNNYVLFSLSKAYLYYDDHLEDDVSDLQWCKTMNRFNYFATSSWDGYVRLYEVRQKTIHNDSVDMQVKAAFPFDTPVLSLTWTKNGDNLLCTTTDNFIQLIDLNAQKVQQIGIHQDAVAFKVFVSEEYGIITVGFDKMIQFWDIRTQRPIATLENEREITDAVQDPYMDIMALVDSEPSCKILDYEKIKGRYDIKNAFVAEHSKLGHNSQLSCVSLDIGSNSVAYGSVDGRVNASSINSRLQMRNELQFKSSILKGDPLERPGQIIAFPHKVTALQLYPVKGSEQFLLTGSSDGRLIFWETSRRNRVGFIEFPQTQIVKAQISNDGKYVGFALGYTWSEGLWGANKAANPFTGVLPIEDKQRQCAIQSALQYR